MRIEDARDDDLPAILAIYNDAVLNTTAIWNWDTVDLANRQAWFAARENGQPIIVPFLQPVSFRRHLRFHHQRNEDVSGLPNLNSGEAGLRHAHDSQLGIVH